MYLTPDAVREPLYVITTVFNPVRFKSRWKLYQRFAKYVQDSGAILVTVEAAFGRREHAVVSTAPEHEQFDPVTLGKTRDEQHRHIYIKVRTSNELWIKENLINIGLSRLPANWKYVAWVDADVMFTRPNWVGETIHQLQHHAFVQMFSYALDLGPNYEPLAKHRGFVDCYESGLELSTDKNDGRYYQPGGGGGVPGAMWHPGYAWAARRDAIDAVGGLVDWGILGAGDRHVASALIGAVETSIPPGIHPEYLERLLHWQGRAERYIRRNVGAMKGLLVHYWHGRKVDRGYLDRWQILVKHQYRPSIDLKADSQGVHQLCDHGDLRTTALRDDIRGYFRQRNEDSIDE